MRYDTECKEASERLFSRIHGHLISIRDTFNLPMADTGIETENNALLTVLEKGDAMEIESALYDIDRGKCEFCDATMEDCFDDKGNEFLDCSEGCQASVGYYTP